MEKDVEEVDAPKVAEAEEKADLTNGTAEVAAAKDATDNGTTEKVAEDEESKEAVEEEKEAKNGDSTGKYIVFLFFWIFILKYTRQSCHISMWVVALDCEIVKSYQFCFRQSFWNFS